MLQKELYSFVSCKFDFVRFLYCYKLLHRYQFEATSADFLIVRGNTKLSQTIFFPVLALQKILYDLITTIFAFEIVIKF